MATLNVSITESVTLNGKDHGGTYSGFSNTSITQVEKRLINATTTEVTLYGAANAMADGTGGPLWDDDSVKYVRITNLSANSNFVYITIANSANDEAVFKLYGTESLLLWRHAGSFEAIAGAATQTNVADIDLVTVLADSSTQAVELFIASTDAA
tara:strand:- start:77 stop:541 length:465 start_codon:yes stop_codon:yes gene_type:complete